MKTWLKHRLTRKEMVPESLLTDISPDRFKLMFSLVTSEYRFDNLPFDNISTSSEASEDLSLIPDMRLVGSLDSVRFSMACGCWLGISLAPRASSFSGSSGFSEGCSVVSEEDSNDSEGSAVLIGSSGSELSTALESSSEVGVLFPSSMPESELEVLPDASLSGLSWSSSDNLSLRSSCSFKGVSVDSGVLGCSSSSTEAPLCWWSPYKLVWLVSDGSLMGA